MTFTRARDFTAARAWDALEVAEIEGAKVRLHWTDQRYKWHVNDGAEVFVVLVGAVEMRWRDGDGREHARRMDPGDLCHAAGRGACRAPGRACAHPRRRAQGQRLRP